MADTDLLDYAGLKHYDSKIKACMWNWQKTNKDALVQFKPVPESDLEPVVDFIFTETPPASGDKSPSNPSTITGVSSAKVTRCGKNVCSTNNLTSATIGLFTLNASTGGIKIFGTTGSSGGALEFRSIPNSMNALDGGMLQRGKTYTFSHTGDAPANTYPLFKLYTKDTASSGWTTIVELPNGSSATYTIPSTVYACLVRIDLGFNASYDCECFVQIEEGSTATSFEPYSGNDYTVSLGDTYFGGSLDVATGVMTVTWVGETITTVSTHDAMYTNTIRFVANTVAKHKSASYTETSLACNKFIVANNQNDEEHCRLAGANDGTSFYLFIAKSRLDVSGAVDPSSPTSAEWDEAARAWLAENPVLVAFEFATPTTVQLTPAQIQSLPALDKYKPRINTVYTDQEAVQVGYQRFYDENRIAAIEARLDALEA